MIIWFEDKKTGKKLRSDYDLGLVISSVVISSPEIRTNYIEVPGSDGYIDYTDYFGEPSFLNRTIVINCGFRVIDRMAQESIIRNAIHGKTMKIYMEDCFFYFEGRISVSEMVKTTKVESLTITADVYPWKLKNGVTEVSTPLTTTYKSITLTNGRRPVIPSIVVTKETTLQIGSSTVTISAGEHKVLSLQLKEGATTISAKTTSGTGTITFKYQEGSL